MARKASINRQESEQETPLETASKQVDHKDLCEAIAWVLGRPLTPDEERNLWKTTAQNSQQQDKSSEPESTG